MAAVMNDRVTQQFAEFLRSSTDFLALPFERNFESKDFTQFASNNWPLAFGLVAAYMVVIFGGRYLMKDRPAFELRLPLAAWNALLCVFSFIGMCRTMPFLFSMIISSPYEETVCRNPTTYWGRGTTGLWVMLFIYSKIPELVDTVFIVLRKKPLIFLHWYHHVTVLLFCWSAYSTEAASGLYFVAMNYTVHALMYGYYCLQALGVCPKSFPAYLITMSQIAQMFIGTFVCISAWYFVLQESQHRGEDGELHSCNNDRSNLIAGGLMYGSYLYLFCEFAVKRYIFSGPRSKSGKGKAAKLE